MGAPSTSTTSSVNGTARLRANQAGDSGSTAVEPRAWPDGPGLLAAVLSEAVGATTGTTTRRFPAWPMFAMAMVALVDQIDVSVARGVLPILEDEWDLSDAQLGLT